MTSDTCISGLSMRDGKQEELHVSGGIDKQPSIRISSSAGGNQVAMC